MKSLRPKNPRKFLSFLGFVSPGSVIAAVILGLQVPAAAEAQSWTQLPLASSSTIRMLDGGGGFSDRWLVGDAGLVDLGLPAVGLPALGITGLGIATTIATVVHMVMLGAAVAREHEEAPVRRRLDPATVRAIVILGVPIAIHMSAEIGIFVGIIVIHAWG